MTEQVSAEAVEAVRVAAGRVLVNAANFPAAIQARVLGQDMAPLIDKVTESVTAALPYLAQPARAVPSAEEVGRLLGVCLWDAPSFRADVRIDFHEDGHIISAVVLNARGETKGDE